uniref:Uncharacterized protein n=1 Tax=Octactis speculum TaxID=3111310 RepID=A0A7S2MEF9_9STRA
MNRPPIDPFADGPIPAAQRGPGQHWGHIKGWNTVVSDITRSTDGLGSRRGSLSTVIFGAVGGAKKSLEDGEDWRLYKADFGGENGHEPEAIDMKSSDPIGVTRCTSTRFALTAYYCGLEIAKNLDRDKRATTNATQFLGVDSLGMSLVSMWDRQSRLPAVYRLGIGSKKHSTPSQSHVWSIVANPDGSFHWLQSFISHYTLHEWMDLCDKRGEASLTLDAILAKLNQIRVLQEIEEFDYEANRHYLELFNVDILDVVGNSKYDWNKDDHRLEHFVWDLACVFPVPDGVADVDGEGRPL